MLHTNACHELNNACVLAGTREEAPTGPAGPESIIHILDGIMQTLADTQFLGKSYSAYAEQCCEATEDPDVPEVWISAADSARRSRRC